MKPIPRYVGTCRLPTQVWREDSFLIVFIKVLQDVLTNWQLDDRYRSYRFGHGTPGVARSPGRTLDIGLLTLGACGVSLGSLMASAGAYLKARAMVSSGSSGAIAGESKPSARRGRGGCDVCHGDLPVIHCKVHEVHLCPDCVPKHYDPRSCTYIPSTRGTSPKTGKALAKVQGA